MAWADAAACTLPTAERPLRVADFDELFRSSLRRLEQDDPTRARLYLSGGVDLMSRTQQLADAESSCCSFFTFRVEPAEDGEVVLHIEVPPLHGDVLGGLLARAEAVVEVAR